MPEENTKGSSELRIGGMHCVGCVQTIERALKNVPGVQEASVNLLTEKAFVEHDVTLPVERLVKAVRDAGYAAEPIAPTAVESKTVPITGMTCASCVQSVERALEGIDGVSNASVNLTTEKAVIELASDVDNDRIIEAVQQAGYGVGKSFAREEAAAQPDLVERDVERLQEAKRRAVIAWSLSIPIIGWMIPEMFFGIMWPSALWFHVGMVLLAAPVVFIAGWPTIRSGVRAGLHLSPTMDTLIALGAGASFLTGIVAVLGQQGWAPQVLDYAGVSAMIMAFHLTGRLIETTAKGRASQAIKRLLTLGAKTARILRGDKEIEVPIARIVIGDVMVVRPGEKIPTDGVVVGGESHVDESIATGESMPVRRAADDQVIGATINGQGILRVRATAIGEETFLSQVIRMVEQAQGTKVPIQAFADRITRIFVPIVLLVAIGTLVLWLVAPGPLGALAGKIAQYLPWVSGDFSLLSSALFAAIAVLVIACPCALGLATPTALMVGSGKGAENGILIRSGEAIQTMREVNTVVLDKTGTVTEGRPTVTDVLALAANEEELLKLAGSVEAASEHPLGRAVTAACKDRGISLEPVERFEAVTGKGVRGIVGGEEIFIGRFDRTALADDNGRELSATVEELEGDGKTVVAVRRGDGRTVGLLAIADRVKTGAREAIDQLSQLGLKVVLLTGDNQRTAEAVGRSLGIEQVIAEVLPDQKLRVIEDLQRNGSIVAMVGDGINDAPALKAANVGIALGTGTDVAIETGDITLVSGEISAVVRAIRLSRATFRKIKQNLFWAVFYNLIAIPLAVLGLLHPLIAEAAMALSSINVVTNANRLRRVRLDAKG
ncbi:MAG: heavy metal translocating P-type ATPase [Candidatus Bipolaricaulia bacterium]